MANTCCPIGYSYDSRGFCYNPSSPDIGHMTPLPCSCCPVGYIFINDSGFFNTLGGLVQITNPNISDFYNTCVTIVNQTWAIPSPTDPPTNPIACPCCPEGYIYDNVIGKCKGLNPSSPPADTIPCLNCNCVTQIPPSCATCGTSGQPINFQFNFFTRNCVNCPTLSDTNPRGRINCFLPSQFVNPFINFTLKKIN